ncbi:MAG: AAA family ATPase [Deltaproteobacteria bacterium]|nr:AAA family ATPase [Deltaproteobacteria bacterium]
MLQFLRDFLDVDLKSVELVRDHRFTVTHAQRVPSPDLSSFGDGLQRAFQIGLLFGGAEGGVLLIDELENALHTSLLIDFTKLIQQLAVEFNVQVFITTHSKETVDAFLFNEYRIEDVVAYRLERDGETTLARRHQGSSLIQAVRAVDLDIRWSK